MNVMHTCHSLVDIKNQWKGMMLLIRKLLSGIAVLVLVVMNINGPIAHATEQNTPQISQDIVYRSFMLDTLQRDLHQAVKQAYHIKDNEVVGVETNVNWVQLIQTTNRKIYLVSV